MDHGGVQVNDSMATDLNSTDSESPCLEKSTEKDIESETVHEYPILNFNPPTRLGQTSREPAKNKEVENDAGFKEKENPIPNKIDIPETSQAPSEQNSMESAENLHDTNVVEEPAIAHEDDAASNSPTVVPDETLTESTKALELTNSVDFVKPSALANASGLASTSGFTNASDFTHTSDLTFPPDHKETGPYDGLEQNESDMPTEQPDVHQLGSLALALLVTGICLAVFLISLDRTIVATAVPRITDQFHSYNDVGWYGSAYLITACALQPTYGRIYGLFDIKWSFLTSMIIFEIGSLICATTPNSLVLIIGRAIAGWGSAGILTGSFIAVAHSVPLQKRPIYTGIVGIMFGLGALSGPLLGGVFTDRLTWRWCFYFNLPVGGFTIIVLMFFFNPQAMPAARRPLLRKIQELDLIGNVILLGAAVMFFLALQYGGSGIYTWSSPRVAGLLAGAGATLIVFLTWQWKQGDKALIPPSIALQRSVAASCLSAFFIYSTLLIGVYYLPIWFQAIKGDSPILSGVSTLPYVIANAICSLLAGAAVSIIGYFAPPAIIGSAIGTVGSALLSTLQVDTPAPMWIGYQVVVAAGLGIAIQQGFIAVQTVLSIEQLPIGTAAITCFQSLGGAVFVSVGNSILQDELLSAGKNNQLPGVDIKAVIAAGATQFRSFVPPEDLPALLLAYNHALQKVFTAAIPMSGLAFFAALALEWKSVREKKSSLEAGHNPVSNNATEESLDSHTEMEETKSQAPPATSMDGFSLPEQPPAAKLLDASE